jgi:hypothetical protein
LEDEKGHANRGRSDKFKPLVLGEIQAGGDKRSTVGFSDRVAWRAFQP